MNIIHGDVDLIQVTKIPAKAVKFKIEKQSRGIPIELGEHSGHAHCIAPTKSGSVNIYMNDNVMYIDVLAEPAIITHEEHAPLLIPVGKYKKIIEKEYDPFDKIIKQVVD
jgi:hypothetical protein